MVDVYLEHAYTLHLTRRELRIIGLALSGKLWSGGHIEDQDEGRVLNEKLVRVLMLRSEEHTEHWRSIIAREFDPERSKP